MAKNITYSTESNLLGYVTRHFQERMGSISRHDQVQITSVHIGAAASTFFYTVTSPSGKVQDRVAIIDHLGVNKGDLIAGYSKPEL